MDVSGRRYEIDLLVLGYDAIYHIEIKSHPGRVSGDVVDWRSPSRMAARSCATDVKIDLKDAARAKVITRGELLRAMQFVDYPGAGARRRTRIDRPTAKKVVEGALRVGPYKLGTLLAEGPGFQD